MRIPTMVVPQNADPIFPRWRVTRWLTRPASEVPSQIETRLLSSFVASTVSLVAGAIATTLVNVAAALRHPEPAFVALAALDLLVVVARFGACFVLMRTKGPGRALALDLFILMSLAWAVVIGIGAALCLASGDRVLEVLAPVTMVAMSGGIATRNHGVPRLALLQIVACNLPFTLVALVSPEPGMSILVILFGLYLISIGSAVRRLHGGFLTVALAECENERRATHDALTGLLNRPGLIGALAASLERTSSGSEPFALLYIDLDGFKRTNDELGHAAGDVLLQGVASRFSAVATSSCIVARIGGDEFVVVAPNHGRREARTLGQRLVQAGLQPYDLGGGRLASVGASVGICCAAPGMTVEDLLAEADAALYRAKAGGKNRVMLAAGRALSTPDGDGLQVA